MHVLVDRIAHKLAEERGEELGCDMQKGFVQRCSVLLTGPQEGAPVCHKGRWEGALARGLVAAHLLSRMR